MSIRSSIFLSAEPVRHTHLDTYMLCTSQEVKVNSNGSSDAEVAYIYLNMYHFVAQPMSYYIQTLILYIPIDSKMFWSSGKVLVW